MPTSYSATELMEMAVDTEKGGKLFYETVAAQTKDDNLKGLFSYLADEENKHIRVFEDIAKTIKVASDELQVASQFAEVNLGPCRAQRKIL